MTINELQAAIEAILFASGEPVSVDKLVQTLSINKATVKSLMEVLTDKFDSENSGIYIAKLDEKYQMCSKPQYGEYVRAIMDIRRNVPLSQAAMEVLAIVAYNQPVTKAFIEQIRGVDCSGVISSLVSKDLISEKGRLELPGRPLLYGTTSNFLRCFGISSVDELPALSSENKDELDKKEDDYNKNC